MMKFSYTKNFEKPLTGYPCSKIMELDDAMSYPRKIIRLSEADKDVKVVTFYIGDEAGRLGSYMFETMVFVDGVKCGVFHGSNMNEAIICHNYAIKEVNAEYKPSYH